MDSKLTFSVPRWRLTRWLVGVGHDVPHDVRVALIGSLFGTLPIFAGGVLNTLIVSTLGMLRHPSPWFVGWLVLEILICGTRLVVLLRAHRAAAQGKPTPTDFYLVLALAWAFSVGYGVFMSMTSGDWVIATMACLSSAAMVGGICFRNFAAPRLVGVMIFLSLGPCCLAALFAGEPLILVTLLQIPFYLFSMTTASYRLNSMLVSTMRAERENSYQARHDELTGVSNRAGLLAVMAHRVSSHEHHAVFYLDLDGFKQVNDSRGHAAGDRLLRMVADRLKGLLKPEEVVARIGGDEFVVMTRSPDRKSSVHFGDSIIAAVSLPYDLGDGVPVAISGSVGIALIPEHGTATEEVLAAADAALYVAKSLGKGRCAVAVEKVDAGTRWALRSA
ncbi:GGDEF domain-containing protein [Pigmentiphaga litoralis]|uniref:Diguanylate cyclase (GGDEF)-like protein n=1 Tax=Pigmentiphaga litoralis TaxID=516702 RepID=A0A7Y9LN38_9BURK|nr:diguanylate cyclase [Pigmentiphaga litoralis]NYE23618.1 diguanylate cyclase (GGDEF)-like protein [Pigmentiphaga litoralis]NYE82768.1 diguanylate cyclase (GGDEF)-like protein [Pigmentiphaga litoralis]